jgi:hypothetical protein
MSELSVKYISELDFGTGQIGQDAHFDRTELGDHLASSTRLITVHNSADCVDGRRIISLADGTTDPEILAKRVAHQLAGGLVLAVTKAATAADLAVVRDAKSFKDTYIILHDFLSELGYRDSGHVDCGASKKVKDSVIDQVPFDSLLGVVGAIRDHEGAQAEIARANLATKQRKLEEGFYDSWSNTWHEDFLSQRAPENFAELEGDDTPLNGHYEEALYLVPKPGYGLAKNSFIHSSGSMVFCETTHTALNLVTAIANKIHASEQERRRFLFEFDADGPSVLNKLVAKGLAVFST